MRSDDRAFSDLMRVFPRSLKVGCSDSGEIYGNRIFDGTLSVAVAQFERSTLR
jgi:hypothetical protein